MTKFLVEIDPEFEETNDELLEIISEAIRDSGYYAKVTYVQE